MSRSVIVPTDFSDSSQNALNYACEFARYYDFSIVLVRIFTIPAAYAGEGLSMATVNDAMAADKERLNDELKRVEHLYASLSIEARLVVGGYLDALSALNVEFTPDLIIMGAAGEYSELWEWDDDWLAAVLSLACPVLVIPSHITHKPVKQIAFACDYTKPCTDEQISTLKRLVTRTGAKMKIVHVTTTVAAVEDEREKAFKSDFSAVDPAFVTIEAKNIIGGIADFTKQHHTDMLVVIPRKHGLWHKIFNKSYSRQLARLNNLPVLALHDK